MRKFALGLVTGLLIIPVGAVLVAWLGFMPTIAKARPPAWEGRFAHMALMAAAARRAPQLTNPIPPTEANLLKGVKLFKGDCAGCHGSAAVTVDTSVGLYPDAPHFAKHHPRAPDWQLFWIVKNGVRYSGMFSWDGQWGKDSITGKDSTDEKIWTTVTFLKHLDSLPPSVDAEWHKKSSPS